MGPGAHDHRPPKRERSSAFVLAAAYTAWSAFCWWSAGPAALPTLFGGETPEDVRMFVILNGVALAAAAFGLLAAFHDRPAVAVTVVVGLAFLVQLAALVYVNVA